ncbi:S-adenosyl-L-methionine-dependent methyltransferase [Tribonema minus]|uniref:S-adenosyl-L-methionine-dependent methyltransferase n=1 Tax=Tribonema minus TaxID=303371 RepID=A0A835YPE5_9STRA|nr:S-adenosyl-L-methionine-dependent methyltransferase [Tribonema minus]
MKGGEEEKAADFANYFCSYASLYHQKQMLTDHRRMQAYHGAIMQNRGLFAGKRVLDVGTGSGILALWCAKAGAAKVFAVEYTDMAKHARKLIEANGASDIVEVIQSSVEALQLDGPVDIIISEWMGYFLLRESMLDSVVRARDRWLAPGGLMFPSHATMYWGLVSDEEDRLAKAAEYLQSTQEWHRFKREMRQYYDCDMNVLEGVYEEEQKGYYILSSFWAELQPDQCVGQGAMIKHFDMHTCTLEDVQGVEETPFRINVEHDCRVSGFAGWFTADFRGTEANPLPVPVLLSTAPDNGYTHWGQQVFYLEVPHWVPRGGAVEGTLALTRQKENIRLYDVGVKHRRHGNSQEPNLGPMQEATYTMP